MPNHTEPIILDHMAALAESARCRLLSLLEDRELTVSDLCAVLQLPQSTVSRHLKTLLDKGWVEARADGTSRLYHATVEALDTAAQELWKLTRAQIDTTLERQQDRQRLQSVLARHRSRSREFFDETSDRWDEIRDEMFGRQFYLSALAGLVPSDWTVADLGCGTGTLAEALAPFVHRVVGVDASSPMLEMARRRLERFDLEFIYPGHGPLIDDPAGVIGQYIHHRLEREAQILAALAAGADTPARIRARVYGKLDPGLHLAAEGSVAAHLAKLVDEGRVRLVGDQYTLAG